MGGRGEREGGGGVYSSVLQLAFSADRTWHPRFGSCPSAPRRGVPEGRAGGRGGAGHRRRTRLHLRGRPARALPPADRRSACQRDPHQLAQPPPPPRGQFGLWLPRAGPKQCFGDFVGRFRFEFVLQQRGNENKTEQNGKQNENEKHCLGLALWLPNGALGAGTAGAGWVAAAANCEASLLGGLAVRPSGRSITPLAQFSPTRSPPFSPFPPPPPFGVAYLLLFSTFSYSSSPSC